MSNTITILTGDKASGKCFPADENRSFPTWHSVEVCPVESLKDIEELLLKHKRDPNKYLIRGIPNKDQDPSHFRRLNVNTTDTLLNWIMLDIDGIPKTDTLQNILIERLPFVTKDTGMLIDWSSKEGVVGPDVDFSNQYYAHIFLWSDDAFTSQDWKDRLIQYDFIDPSTLNHVQQHYFVDPIFYEGYGFKTKLKERTFRISGENIASGRVPPPEIKTEDIQVNQDNRKGTTNIEDDYLSSLIEGKRHTGLHAFFCKVVAKGESESYWIDRYLNDPRRSPDHHSLEKLEAVMVGAKEYVFRHFTSWLTPRYPTIEMNTPNLQEELVKLIDYRSRNVLLIKSGQMTFKTQSLKNIPDTVFEGGYDNEFNEIRIERPTRILLIGHRIGLIRQICEELDLTIYDSLPEFLEEEIDGKTLRRQYPIWEQNRLGVTFDSLWRTYNDNQPPTYDFIILDESDQVIAELLTTDRIMEKTPNYQNKKIQTNSEVRANVGRVLQANKTVIALDADLSDLTQNFIEDWRTDNFQIYHNKYKSLEGREVRLLKSEDSFIGQIKKDIRDGKKVFITCDTKKSAQIIHLELESLFDPPSQRHGRNAKGIKITGSTWNELNKAIARDPNSVLPTLMDQGLQWLIVSPVLETGVSIGTNDDPDHRFNSVYGIWKWKEYTANTFRQAISRVRNADNYYVYIPSGFRSPEDIDSILDYVEKCRSISRNLDRTEQLKRLCLNQKELSQSSKVLHFQYLLEEVGANLIRHKSEVEYSCYEWNEIKKALETIQVQAILNVKDPVKTDEEYAELGFTEADYYRRWDYEVRLAFDTEKITESLIRRWNFGRIQYEWDIREVLQKSEHTITIEENNQLLGDSRHKDYIYDALTKVFKDFGILDQDHKLTDKRYVLFPEHINQDTLDWLCKEDVLKALKYLLGWWNLELSNPKQLKAEPLRLYAKLSGLAHYSVTYFADNDSRLRIKLIKIDDVIELYTELDLYCTYGYDEDLIFSKGHKYDLNDATKTILEHRILGSERGLDIEIRYYRQRNKHLLLQDYKPTYSSSYLKKLSDQKSHINESRSGKKRYLDQVSTG